MGIDLAKRIDQLQGNEAVGLLVIRKRVSRLKVRSLSNTDAPALIAKKNRCIGAHHLGRGVAVLGYAVKPMPSIDIRPSVKRQKNNGLAMSRKPMGATPPHRRSLPAFLGRVSRWSGRDGHLRVPRAPHLA